MNEARLQELADRITTDLLGAWYQQQTQDETRAAPHLLQALPAIALADRRCEGQPLFAYLKRRLDPTQPLDVRIATIEALLHMAETTSNPAETVTTLRLGLRESNLFIRTHAAAALAQMGASITHGLAQLPLRESLADLMALFAEIRNDEEYLPERFLNSQPLPSELPALVQDLRETSPAAFTRAAFCGALGVIGAVTTASARPNLIETLRTALQDPVWLVGVVAGEAIAQLQATNEIVTPFLEGLKHPDRQRRLRSARALGRAGSCGPAVGEALMAQAASVDLRLAAAAIESLGQAASPGQRGRAVSILEQIQSQAGWILEPITAPAIRRLSTGPVEGEATSTLFQIIKGEDPVGTPGGSRSLEREAELTSGRQERTAHLLYAAIGTPDHTPLGEEVSAARTAELEGLIRQTRAFQALAGSGFLMPYQRGLVVICGDSAHTPAHCAIEVAAAAKRLTRRPILGLHTGPITLKRTPQEGWELTGQGLNTAVTIAECGDPGSILLSRSAAKALAPPFEWSSFIHDLGECNVRAQGHVHLHSLYDPQGAFGNAELPSRVLRTQNRRNADSGTALRRLVGAVVVLFLLTVIGISGWTVANAYFTSLRVPPRPAQAATTDSPTPPEDRLETPVAPMSSQKKSHPSSGGGKARHTAAPSVAGTSPEGAPDPPADTVETGSQTDANVPSDGGNTPETPVAPGASETPESAGTPTAPGSAAPSASPAPEAKPGAAEPPVAPKTPQGKEGGAQGSQSQPQGNTP